MSDKNNGIFPPLAIGAAAFPATVSSTDDNGVGTIRWNGNKCYKWVKFKNTTATVTGAIGDVLGYTADGYDVHTVCSDLSDADTVPIPAGVCAGTVAGTLTVTYYCWIQIKGPATINTAPTSGADGIPLYLTATDKTLAKAAEADSAATLKMVCAWDQDDSEKQIICDFPY